MKNTILKRLCALALVVVLLTSLCGCTNLDYKKAESLMEEKSYQEAIELYKSMEENGGYKDSAEKIKECNYNLASEKFDSKDYIKAYELYESLGDYKDSVDLAKNAGYVLASTYVANDNFSEAYLIFSKLGDYKKSKSLASKCESYMLKNAKVGDAVYYGLYEQDGDSSNGLEPIHWIVMATNKDSVLLLSKYILEKMEFGRTHYWEESSLREWLNNDFYKNAFSKSERKSIQRMITSEKTNDNVFCLSAEEARGLFPNDESRKACPTEALIKNEFKTWGDCGNWWTRSISTASDGKGVVPVEGDGNVRSAGTVPYYCGSYTNIGARPAICVSLTTTSKKAQNMNRFGFDSNTDLDHEPDLWSGKSHSSSGSSSGKCIVCNGTGTVKYYYGSSDLEAWLSGHDAYTFGKCTSCNGTGKG